MSTKLLEMFGIPGVVPRKPAPEPLNTINFIDNDGRVIITIHLNDNARVEVRDGVAMDAATRFFWQGIANYARIPLTFEGRPEIKPC